jgi:hypothetical protein
MYLATRYFLLRADLLRRKAARERRRRLYRELAEYSSPSARADFEAMLDRYSDGVAWDGDVGGQIFAAGLVDEVAMDVVPVVFGTGKRFFGGVDGRHLLEDPQVVIEGERVLHLRFAVRRQSPTAPAPGAP